MNQTIIGNFIAKKRKEKNMTQAQLAERIGVSNKTVSKWETGKCMPDYSVIETLCQELGISVAELIGGREAGDNNIHVCDDSRILGLVKRTQVLEQQRRLLCGLVLIIMGMVLLVLHYDIGGSSFKDFFSGLLLGMSVAVMLAGVFVSVRGLSEQK